MTKLSEHFRREEFACKDKCGFDTVDSELVLVLEDLRNYFGKPVHISSGCRCEKYNKKVGGEDKSKHLQGRAADLTVVGHMPDEVQEYLLHTYQDKYGIGRYKDFTHIDTRTDGPARWDMR